MHKVTILHLAPQYTYLGGVSRWLLNAIAPKSSQKHSHRLLTFHQHGVDDIIHAPETKARFGEISHIELNYLSLPVFVVKLFVFLVRRHPDVVIAHGNWSQSLLTFVALLAGVKTRILYNHAGNWVHAGGVMREVGSRLLVSLGRHTATEYWFASEGCRNRWRKEITGLKTRVVMTGIPLTHNSVIAKDVARKSLNWPHEAFIIGHVGRFTDQKNHRTILNSFSLVAEKDSTAILVLIGDGPLFPDIQKQTIALGLKDKVIFMGIRHDVMDCLAGMDLFFFPSFHEALGIAALEAQSLGLPIVASNVPGLAEAIAPGWKVYTHEPLDVNEFARDILSLRNAERFIPTEFLTTFDSANAAERLDAAIDDAVLSV